MGGVCFFPPLPFLSTLLSSALISPFARNLLPPAVFLKLKPWEAKPFLVSVNNHSKDAFLVFERKFTGKVLATSVALGFTVIPFSGIFVHQIIFLERTESQMTSFFGLWKR
jgi:hypothetical protein